MTSSYREDMQTYRTRPGEIFDYLARRASGPTLNWPVAGLIAVALAVLFYVDATHPRGVLDGVGYPAAIALAGSFGRRTVFAIAAVATALTVVAFFLTPPGGIGLLGTLANRSFAIASVWIVALALARRIRLEREIADGGAWFRSLFDQLPLSVSIHDLQDRFLLANRANEELLGLKSDDTLNRTRQDVWDEVGLGQVPRPYIEQALETVRPVRTAPLELTAQGKRGWYIGTVFPILDAEGRPRAVGTAAQNITDLWETRSQLETREAALDRFQKAFNHAVRNVGIFERSYLEAVRALTEIAGAALDADRTAVFHAAIEDQWLDRVDVWIRETGTHLPKSAEPNRLYPQLAPLFERDGVIAIDDVDSDDRVASEKDLLRQLNVGAMLLAPIFVGRSLHGQLVFSQLGNCRRWTSEAISFARSVADLLGLLLVMNRHRETLAALDLIDEAIYVQNEDDRVIYANRSAMKMAAGADRLLPQHMIRGLSVSRFPRPNAPLAGTDDTIDVPLEIGGEKRDLEITRHRVPAGGIVVVVNDKTAQKAEQVERERLQDQLQQAMKIEAIGLLAAGIAHDFNNLLGAISGFARFLEQDLPAGSPEHQFARRILNACHRGRTITSQILMFAQSRAKALRPTDVGQVARDCAEVLQGLLSPATTFDFACEDLPMSLTGDEGQIVQLLVNLCTNANSALGGRPGCISLRVSRVLPVDLNLGSSSGSAQFSERAGRLVLGRPASAASYALIRVRDSGSGIGSDILPRIFEPFFSDNERSIGTGLGLAVVRRVVAAHNGALAVDTAPGAGSCFSIYLPLDERLSVPNSGAKEPERLILRGSERVLIVDDEVDITDMLSIGLERLGYEVASLNDPEEALVEFKRDPFVWDVVVTDQRMPGMEGLSFARHLKAIRDDIKVILCTGVAGKEFLEQADPILDGFFLKPVAPEQIAERIRLLGRIDHSEIG